MQVNEEQKRQHAAHLARRARMGGSATPQTPIVLRPAAPIIVKPKLPARLVYSQPIGPMDLRSVTRILSDVCYRHAITLSALKGKERFQPLVRARHEAMWLLHHALPNCSLTQIGRWMERDHTTVIHGIRKHQSLLDQEKTPRRPYPMRREERRQEALERRVEWIQGVAA